MRPEDHDSESENASLRRAAQQRADETAASLESWLRRAMTRIAERGADKAAPVDLTESLAAMAALLNEASRGAPTSDSPQPPSSQDPFRGAGAREAVLPPVSADAPGDRAISAPAGQSARARALSELKARLDDLERIIRAGGRAAADPALRLALKDIETRLRSSANSEPDDDGPSGRETPSGTGAAALTPAAPGEPPERDGEIGGLQALTKRLRDQRSQRQASRAATDAGAVETLAPELRALTRQIEMGQRQLGEKVETELQSLTFKLEATRKQSPGDLAMDALEQKIAAITQRLETTDRGFASIANLEQTIARLSEQLGQDAEGKDRILDSSNEAREEADRRVHLALNAVQESVGQIANRLARIEADIGEARPARDAAPEEPVRRTATDVATQAELLTGQAAANGGRSPNAVGDDILIEPGAGLPWRFGAPPDRLAAVFGHSAGESGAVLAPSPVAAKPLAPHERPVAIPADLPAARAPAPKQNFFRAHRASLVSGLAALSLALGVIALAKTGALKPVRPAALLKPVGQARTNRDAAKAPAAPSAAQAEAPPPAAPQNAAAAVGGIPKEPTPPSAPAQPEPPKPTDLSLFDPAALNAGQAGSIRAAAEPGGDQLATPLTRLIAGSDPILFEGVIARAEPATAPGGFFAPSLSPASLLKSGAPPALAPANLARLAGTPLDDLRARATAGDGAAQFELGARYADGRAGVQDLALAAGYYAKAAGSGLALAQYRLATMTEKGAGVSRDLGRAKALYEAAAAQGNVRAMHNLGVLAAQGAEAGPDYTTAAVWFEQAAKFDVRDSQFNLAVLLARGLGTPPDAGRAYVWFSIAAAGGDAEADRKRADIATKLSREDLDAAKAAVLSFRPQTLDPLANELSLTSSRAARN
ncbi:Sel1 domain protein repeat-containing protein [Methylocella silvestris BL2]|uniref:Sel1 domain protein repeat-containing protein n=1 Tax=Methylocella silvestris (strain DSM 15510 / CIP 108128 / LMG 27833 / NCIMB 13906 / BL2) TaxID=395965 RepID=B8EP06_METSB|nr:tetratricopeptide repeat protein [Methylocella silvestris]ACK49244.1 Sel1 domain protein repeat-containing protein [Methylocella silvestris BL2]